MIDMARFTDVFFEADNYRNIIDCVDPTTGRSAILGETLDDVRKRHPSAQRSTWDEWRAAAAARQDQPLTWTEVTAQQYQRMLEVLPPAGWIRGGFLVGEPADHSFATGSARFDVYVERFGHFFTGSRPITRAEFLALMDTEPAAPAADAHDSASEAHRAADPHCTCNDCIAYMIESHDERIER